MVLKGVLTLGRGEFFKSRPEDGVFGVRFTTLFGGVPFTVVFAFFFGVDSNWFSGAESERLSSQLSMVSGGRVLVCLWLCMSGRS